MAINQSPVANSFFNFKEFSIEQDRSAMKVCTDSCLFGAWTASHPLSTKEHGQILDIGAGTGLLSLLMAQNLPYRIDAIEIDHASAEQAKENIARSPWHERITVHRIALQDFVPDSRYHIIISNPPFYDGDLNSPSAAANRARHNVSLSFIELLNFISQHLEKDGSAFLLIPFRRREELLLLSQQNELNPVHITDVRNTANAVPFRSMVQLSKKNQEKFEDDICIYNDDRKYTEQFSTLLKPYYLFL